MQYRVSRNDQEFGPYTLEELQRYASEGSILPNDYVFNGVEWLLVSQFLEDPHKGMATSQSISSIANLAPQNNFSNEHINAGDSSGKPKFNLKSIVGAIIVIAIITYNFFNNQNAERAQIFNNGLVELMEEDGRKLNSLSEDDEDYFNNVASVIKSSIKKIEDIPFYEGKNGVGYQLKDTTIKYLEANLKIMNQLSQLQDSIHDNEKEIDSIKINELVESLEESDRKFDKEFDQLQKQYADNNNLELIN
ncbi:MAG: DUF4339 domain-containing protein [Verrucomicrobiota bacterium]|nr:DUF4339 domain-containing protein [Verrucomicrobiota bacterium]